MTNKQPVSDLSVLSKTIERIVAEQLNNYLRKNRLLPRCQSAYTDVTETLPYFASCGMGAECRSAASHSIWAARYERSARLRWPWHPVRLRRDVEIEGSVLSWLTVFPCRSQSACSSRPWIIIIIIIIIDLYSAYYKKNIGAKVQNLRIKIKNYYKT